MIGTVVYAYCVVDGQTDDLKLLRSPLLQCCQSVKQRADIGDERADTVDDDPCPTSRFAINVLNGAVSRPHILRRLTPPASGAH